MEKIITRDIVLDESLKLFSVRGYDGVAISDIAEEMGINEDYVYKFFSTKKDIFKAIIKEVTYRVDAVYKKMSVPIGSNVIEEYANMSFQRLEDLCFEFFDMYLNDEVVSKFRKMLTIQQYSDLHMSKIYNGIFIDGPLNTEVELFKGLKEKGVLKDADPHIMALQFYAPFFLLFYKFDYRQYDEKRIRELIKKQISSFLDNYLVKIEN
ncbi:TetR/AcrR family transcriptional regulator [Metaclostridioides mangenotii]|uniref:TetR/AcrR family transcriptional regulator n=1 Tax=Metaclostridioides mangenotii TaxID=1540 RepID=UPI0004857C06|nr:TetR/AcrR family transcriptional regulator [Clostridioides mangenotii]